MAEQFGQFEQPEKLRHKLCTTVHIRIAVRNCYHDRRRQTIAQNQLLEQVGNCFDVSAVCGADSDNSVYFVVLQKSRLENDTSQIGRKNTRYKAYGRLCHAKRRNGCKQRVDFVGRNGGNCDRTAKRRYPRGRRLRRKCTRNPFLSPINTEKKARNRAKAKTISAQLQSCAFCCKILYISSAASRALTTCNGSTGIQ